MDMWYVQIAKVKNVKYATKDRDGCKSKVALVLFRLITKQRLKLTHMLSIHEFIFVFASLFC